MSKPIIAFDLDGTIISSEAAEKAHKKWFEVMAVLLDDPSVAKLYGNRDYFPDVLAVVARYTGLNAHKGFENKTLVRYARNLYQMISLAEIKKQGMNIFVPGIIEMVKELKKTCMIALITTAPEDVVLPALDIAGIKGLFDYIYRSPIDIEFSKTELMAKFINDITKPSIYVGNEIGDAEACKELGVKFALAKWAKFDPEAEDVAQFNLNSPKQLKGIVELL